MPRIEIYMRGLPVPVVAEVTRYRVSRSTSTSAVVAFEYDAPLGLNPRLAYVDPTKVLAVVELDSVEAQDEEIPHIHEVEDEPRQAELVEAVPIAAPTELPVPEDDGPGLAEG